MTWQTLRQWKTPEFNALVNQPLVELTGNREHPSVWLEAANSVGWLWSKHVEEQQVRDQMIQAGGVPGRAAGGAGGAASAGRPEPVSKRRARPPRTGRGHQAAGTAFESLDPEPEGELTALRATSLQLTQRVLPSWPEECEHDTGSEPPPPGGGGDSPIRPGSCPACPDPVSNGRSRPARLDETAGQHCSGKFPTIRNTGT